MEEKMKMLTIRIDLTDYDLIKSIQRTLKMSSINGVLKHLIYTNDSLYDLYHRTSELIDYRNNKLRDK